MISAAIRCFFFVRLGCSLACSSFFDAFSLFSRSLACFSETSKPIKPRRLVLRRGGGDACRPGFFNRSRKLGGNCLLLFNNSFFISYNLCRGALDQISDTFSCFFV